MGYKKISGKICIQCNKEYSGIPSQKYCGYICAKKARESKINKVCINCNIEFKVQTWSKETKFCSRKCQHIFRKKESYTNLICKKCNNPFERNNSKVVVSKNHFCSKQCADSFNKGENHYEWKPLNHLTNLKDSFRRWGTLVKQRDNYTCQLCGENDPKLLESHHIKEKENYPELQLDINNGVTLCLKCHYLQHINHKKASRLIKYKIDKYYGKDS